MRKVCLLVLLAFGLKGFTQTEMGVSSFVIVVLKYPLALLPVM